MRSSAMPPNTIAPMRPLPIGRASVHFSAGCVYHKRNGGFGAAGAGFAAPQTSQAVTASAGRIPLA